MNKPNASTNLPTRRYRSDGWTPDVQREFIEHLALTGSVRAAAKAVGRSPVTAYRLRGRHDAEAFRAAWAEATAMAYHALHELAMDRVVHGVEEPVLDKDGRCVYVRDIYDNRLLMFMLNHLRPDRPPVEAGTTVERVAGGSPAALASALARLDALPMAIRPEFKPVDPREADPAAAAALDAAFSDMHAELARRACDGTTSHDFTDTDDTDFDDTDWESADDAGQVLA